MFCLYITVSVDLFSNVWISVKTIIIEAIMGPWKILRQEWNCNIREKNMNGAPNCAERYHYVPFRSCYCISNDVTTYSHITIVDTDSCIPQGGIVHLLSRKPSKENAVGWNIDTIHCWYYFFVLYESHFSRVSLSVMFHIKIKEVL